MTASEVRQYLGRIVAVELADGGAVVGKLVPGDFLDVPYAIERSQRENVSWNGLPDASQILAIHAMNDA